MCQCYIEKARKIALGTDQDNDNNNAINNYQFNFSLNQPPQPKINKFAQYPPSNDANANETNGYTHNNGNISTHSQLQQNCVDNDKKSQNNATSMDTDTNSHSQSKKKRQRKKKKKKKGNKENQQYRQQQLFLAKQSRMKYVNMFMVHEWMVDIPHDLTQNVCKYAPSLSLHQILSFHQN